MPRRREIPKRRILPDPIFNDRVVAKFMNSLMLDGKKSVAERIVYGAIDLVEKRAKEEGLRVFKKALENIKPSLEVDLSGASRDPWGSADGAWNEVAHYLCASPP